MEEQIELPVDYKGKLLMLNASFNIGIHPQIHSWSWWAEGITSTQPYSQMANENHSKIE